MSERRQRIWAPVLILVALVILWEALVTAFNIQQFLLPKPSAIIGNLVQVVVLDGSATAGDAGAEVSLNNRFLIFLPGGLSPERQSALEAAQWLDIPSRQRQHSRIAGQEPHTNSGGKLVHIERSAGRDGHGNAGRHHRSACYNPLDRLA